MEAWQIQQAENHAAARRLRAEAEKHHAKHRPTTPEAVQQVYDELFGEDPHKAAAAREQHDKMCEKVRTWLTAEDATQCGDELRRFIWDGIIAQDPHIIAAINDVSAELSFKPEEITVEDADGTLRPIKAIPFPGHDEPKATGRRVNYYLVRVARPQREEQPPYQAECEDIIQALGMDFNEGCIFKALWRSASARLGEKKPGHSAVYDAEKIVHYAERNLRKIQQGAE